MSGPSVQQLPTLGSRARRTHTRKREPSLSALAPLCTPCTSLFLTLSLSLLFLPSLSTPLLYPYLLSIRLSVCIYVSPPLLSFSFFSLSLSLHMYTCVYVYEYILSSGRVRVRLLYPASSLSLVLAYLSSPLSSFSGLICTCMYIRVALSVYIPRAPRARSG